MPVMQTRMASVGGNCLQACLASILELPLDDVPDFPAQDADDWYVRAVQWLYGQGWDATSIGYGDESGDFDTVPWRVALGWLYKDESEYVIVQGRSTSGVEHCVIVRHGAVVHDPHPRGVEMESMTTYWRLIKRP